MIELSGLSSGLSGSLGLIPPEQNMRYSQDLLAVDERWKCMK